MKELKGYQKRYLKGLAHRLKPTVMIGQKGVTSAVINTLNAALETHELIKVKFVEEKEKSQKKHLLEIAAYNTNSHVVGLIGHTGILYRPCSDPEKQAIRIPIRNSN